MELQQDLEHSGNGNLLPPKPTLYGLYCSEEEKGGCNIRDQLQLQESNIQSYKCVFDDVEVAG